MGREIRRVRAGWEHPRYTQQYGTPPHFVGAYRPLIDGLFADAMREWYTEWEAWERGERPGSCSRENAKLEFWQWSEKPPDPEYYRPAWSDDEATHYQYYETVSEGTPLSPPMPSLEELEDWLVENRDLSGRDPMTREQARVMCQSGWAPSGVITGGKAHFGVDALLVMRNEEDAPEDS